ncbi:hypothetical protein [Achromobacter insolitus]|uniref:hypothetical protein n=1 Tax=Achromobacter insolitus TaxID=217204 RepID=UPI0020A2F0A8|nr:hypothetical protein [Achromobacter insolitus]MCP1404279.1 hypothetical protein [Achromobacter insolitus]
MTESEVVALLASPGKLVLRTFDWSKQEGARDTPWLIFDSSVQVGPDIPYALRFIAKYKASHEIMKGSARVMLPEKIDVGLICGKHRIAAYDTAPGQRHTNDVGVGRPFYGQTILATTHRHVWVGEYGYVEPVDPPMLDVVQLIQTFAEECNLVINGSVRHPLAGQQGSLL